MRYLSNKQLPSWHRYSSHVFNRMHLVAPWHRNTSRLFNTLSIWSNGNMYDVPHVYLTHMYLMSIYHVCTSCLFDTHTSCLTDSLKRTSCLFDSLYHYNVPHVCLTCMYLMSIWHTYLMSNWLSIMYLMPN